MSSNTFNLFGGRRSAEAIRSTGYRTTGHALGELVDNSIQAGATEIKIIVEVQQVLREKRTRQTIKRIVTLDNGSGMDAITLRSSLLFGEGSHFNDKGGLGKYGVGLPQASLSQGTKIDIWSWQDGIDSALNCGYDLMDDEWRANGSFVPEPVSSKIPSQWIPYIDQTKNSGTLVVWSHLDRITQTSPTGLFKDSQLLIGRMYRNWIHDGSVKIQFIVLDLETEKCIDAKEYLAVDPLFVMEGTITSTFESPVEPAFELQEDLVKEIRYGDIHGTVIIRNSIARQEIRDRVSKEHHIGTSQLGKLASKNVGLSIVREGRELNLDTRWASEKDSRNRWWGIEVNFGRELDEVFGVTNDKQNANDLCNAFNDSFDNYMDEGESLSDVKARLQEDSPKLAINLDVADTIRKRISQLSKKIPKEKSEKVPDTKTGGSTPEGKATEIIKKEQSKGNFGHSDEVEQKLTVEQKKQQLEQSMDYLGFSADEKNRVVKAYITDHMKVNFVKMEMPGEDEFFTIRTDGGLLLIILNQSHPHYQKLFHLLEYDNNFSELSADELRDLLIQSCDTLKYMLISYSRVEDMMQKNNKTSASRVRKAWGQMCKVMDGISDDD